MLVTLTGTNYRLPTIPAGMNVATFPSVQVLFGGIASPHVSVIDATTVQARVPPYIQRWPPGQRMPSPPFAVSVSIQNLDDTGTPIAGELGTTDANGFTYEIPIHTGDAESDFARLLRTLMRRMKNRLLVGDVTLAVSVDYDPDTGDSAHIVQFATLPSIALVGPALTENRFYSINEQPTIDGPDSDDDGTPIDHVETRVPFTVDATFTIAAATNDELEMLNLMANTIAFFHANKFIYLDRDSDDPTLGAVRYEMDFTSGGLPRATTTPNKDNVRSFSAEFVIRGIDIECFSGMDLGATFGVPNQAIVNRGRSATDLNITGNPR